MAFLQDDDGAFEAALSLLDEFASGATDESELYLTRDNLAEQAGRLNGAPDASNHHEFVAGDSGSTATTSPGSRARQRPAETRCGTAAKSGEQLGNTHAEASNAIGKLTECLLDKCAIAATLKIAIPDMFCSWCHLVLQTNECASLVTTTTHVNRHTVDVLEFHGEIKSFRGLFQLLDEMYRNLDDTFKANGLATMTISPVDVHIRKGADGKSLEFVSYKELPFDMHSTAEATWNHFKGVEKHIANGALYEKAEKVSTRNSALSRLIRFTNSMLAGDRISTNLSRSSQTSRRKCTPTALARISR
ncbi:unnamed protein product [Phytophthora lilii]|uniref:Unnamed protein product n=1 Tax=Phytophthora lilii TaxID=2077276 RepID=A0A9W6TQV5_9STRA|nr:unnamed protein product [Phytophthora lilii]